MLIPVFFIREKDYVDTVPAKESAFRSLTATFKNGEFCKFVGSDIFYWIALTMFQTGLPFFVTSLLKLPETMTTLYFVGMTALSLVFYIPVNKLTPKLGLSLIHILSGGMRQRAALLRTYLSSSGVALLDEPFSALDTLTKASVHKWYLEVMQHIDLSTLFITHDIDEAILLSDRIYILNGTPGTIKDEIVIQERKPRAEDFALSEEFLEYKRQIISKL